MGDRHLRVGLGGIEASGAHLSVRAAFDGLTRTPIHALEDIVPASDTLLLTFDPGLLDTSRAIDEVVAALGSARSLGPIASRLVEIPVCYGEECAPDLADVARLHGLTTTEVAATHAAAEYTVRFIGFAPGFGYLAGLPSALHTPRLATPRVRVPAGSVGLAGDQSGVYPSATPGGWRLIGRTPLTMFDARRDPPARLALGDRVRFVPISHAEFSNLAKGQA